MSLFVPLAAFSAARRWASATIGATAGRVVPRTRFHSSLLARLHPIRLGSFASSSDRYVSM
jgi:hypothetical protein